MKKSSIFIIAVIILTVSSICNLLNSEYYIYGQLFKTCSLSIINMHNNKIFCNAEIALSSQEHSKGLMSRKELCSDCGMLFIFNNEEYRTFWMKNTLIPLSIAFIDAEGIINDIQDMKPLQTFPLYSSKYPAKYALEVNQGWFKKNFINVGSKVILDGCFGK